LKEVADWFEASPAGTPSIHLPFFHPGLRGPGAWISALAREEASRQAARDEIKRALEITDRLPVRWAVVHLGVPGQIFSPVLFDYAFALVEMIRSFAGVQILLETLDNEIATPERIREFIQAAQVPGVRICYDVGHLGPPRAGATFDDAGALHLDDNDGSRDEHLWPFTGNLDWPALAASLAASGFAGPLVFEGPDGDLPKALDAADRLRDLVREAADSRMELDRKHGLRAES
jgi:sugar phosphate isomerase/epimerase